MVAVQPLLVVLPLCSKLEGFLPIPTDQLRRHTVHVGPTSLGFERGVVRAKWDTAHGRPIGAPACWNGACSNF